MSTPTAAAVTASLFSIEGALDGEIVWRVGDLYEANLLLDAEHYLGPVVSGGSRLVVTGEVAGWPAAIQVWRNPTSRRLPADGSWLELSRWCLTTNAGEYAGSRQHRAAVKLIRTLLPDVTTLVSYSDPSQGHTGALYRACNWRWAPTWLRLRPPPTGQGAWAVGKPESIKDRWVFAVQADSRRDSLLYIDDEAAIRYWSDHASAAERRWACGHAQLGVPA